MLPLGLCHLDMGDVLVQEVLRNTRSKKAEQCDSAPLFHVEKSLKALKINL